MIEKLKLYFGETKVELRKVTWPTRKELQDSTKVVIIATIMITVFIGLVDQILTAMIRLIF